MSHPYRRCLVVVASFWLMFAGLPPAFAQEEATNTNSIAPSATVMAMAPFFQLLSNSTTRPPTALSAPMAVPSVPPPIAIVAPKGNAPVAPPPTNTDAPTTAQTMTAAPMSVTPRAPPVPDGTRAPVAATATTAPSLSDPIDTPATPSPSAPADSILPVVDFQPPEVVSSNGFLKVTLNISLLDSLDGIQWSETGVRTAPGYNGASVGPTLRVKPGDTVEVTLNNNLDPSPAIDLELNQYVMDPTSDDVNVTIIYNRLSEIGNIDKPAYGMWGFNFVNLHFHGVDFSPKIEDLRSHVDGGESKTYTFVVPEDKEPGLCWYHNHVHGTAVYSYLASLFGMIIVEGTESDLTKAVGVEEAREVLLIFSDGLVNPDGSVLPSFPVFANFNWTGVTNGHLGEQTVYNVTQGERVLFRATSATSEAIVRLSIPNVTFIVLANDGLVLFEPQETDVILIPGGGRVEFLAQFDEPGTHVMTRAAWSPMFPDAEACAAGGFPFYPCWSFDIDQVAATIVVTENPSFIAPTEALVDSVQLPDVPQRLLSLAATEPVDTKTFIFQIVGAFPIFQIPYDGEFVPPGVGFGVNGRLLTPNYVEGNVTEGTCETWNVVSDPPGAEHAFHIHQATFFVQAIDGVALENPTWHDTIMIQQNATIHICFDRAEAGDAILAHCHAPNHFDIGMGATYNVVPSKSTPSPLANGTSPNPPAAPPLTGSNASVSPVAAPSSSNEGSGTTVHFHLAPLAGLAAMILFFT